MEREALNDDQFIEDFRYRSDLYTNQNSKQDLQFAPESDPIVRQQQLGQRQQTDTFSDKDSYSKRNIPEITDPLARKRAYDKAYRERLKENQKRMKSTLETTEAENGLLKRENESQSKELDGLRNNFEELKQTIKNQHENEQQTECTLKILEAEIKFLKDENFKVNMNCESQSKELGKLKRKYEKQQLMKSNLKTLGAEIESLKEEKFLESQRFENELDKLKTKYDKQLEKRKGMKSNMKALVAENESLKQRLETQSKELDEYKHCLDKLNRKFTKHLQNEQKMKSRTEAEIESLKEKYASVNQSFEAKTKELDEINRNNFYKFNQEFIKKSALEVQSQAGSSINFMEWFGQYPNVETDGFKQSCQVTAPLSSLAFPTSANSPGMELPSPQPGHTFETTPNEFMINGFF